MQLTLHATRRTPHGASRLVQAMSVWSAKLDMLHPDVAGMQAFIPYAHTTTAMHAVPRLKNPVSLNYLGEKVLFLLFFLQAK